MVIEVKGAGGISAKIVADSVSATTGVRLTTFEFVYPRFIHSEVMTHRMLSKNAASSRAVPYKTNRELIVETPAMPVYWGKNQAGMKAKEELDSDSIFSAKKWWVQSLISAIDFTDVLDAMGLHKQITNRILEPWSMMKTVISGTEWNNFFWLRDHSDAQPEISALARCAKEAMQLSVPQELIPGEWHLPYVTIKREDLDRLSYWTDEYTEVSLEEAKTISVSSCCQVSYRKNDYSLEKANKIVKQLLPHGNPGHFSPFEHQATPMQNNITLDTIGVSHMTKTNFWSGNLQGWIQYRKIIEYSGAL